jgi:hypothetical protein
VLAVDFSPEEDKVAIAGGDCCISILDICRKRNHH